MTVRELKRLLNRFEDSQEVKIGMHQHTPMQMDIDGLWEVNSENECEENEDYKDCVYILTGQGGNEYFTYEDAWNEI